MECRRLSLSAPSLAPRYLLPGEPGGGNGEARKGSSCGGCGVRKSCVHGVTERQVLSGPGSCGDSRGILEWQCSS